MKDQYIIIVKESKDTYYAWSDAESHDAFVFNSEKEAIDAWKEEPVREMYWYTVVNLKTIDWL